MGLKLIFFADLLFPQLLEPLKLSPLISWTQRTYDDVAQPFTAYGLVMQADDLLRIADSLSSDYEQWRLLDQEGFEQAMFSGMTEVQRLFQGHELAYKNGFWGTELSAWLNCDKETWIPFMSGYGGISVALIPNKTIYYNFSDSNIFRFAEAVTESNKIRNMCSE